MDTAVCLPDDISYHHMLPDDLAEVGISSG